MRRAGGRRRGRERPTSAPLARPQRLLHALLPPPPPLMLLLLLLLLLAPSTAMQVSEAWPVARAAPELEPAFGEPMGNLTTPLGREAVLTCTVDHLSSYKVGWLKAEDQTILSLHTKVVTHNARITVTHDNERTWRLHIRHVKESDRGCYMCQVNTEVMKKQVGCVDVLVPPDIVYDETSADLSVQEGDNATLVCRATGHPPPRITWRREDGAPILLRNAPRTTLQVESYNGSVLFLWRVDRRQMGAFLCIASNDVPPAVSKRIILNVNFAPGVKVPNQLLGAPLGTDVQMECNVEAFPNTINYWVKNRGEMLLDGHKYTIREKRVGYKVAMWLVIRSFTRADVGTYNCVSTNSLGRAEGTLRLYEIKIHVNSEGGDEGTRAAVVGGLTEASRGQSGQSGRVRSSVSSSGGALLPSAAALLFALLVAARSSLAALSRRRSLR